MIYTSAAHPEQFSVIHYCTEEVRRQAHDTSKLDGIERVGWMLNAWSFALRVHGTKTLPAVEDAIHISALIEPVKNEYGLRNCNVRVGVRRCPDYQDVPRLLEKLFESIHLFQPMDFYYEFEMIHPFVDGNGRTGKVLLNWLNKSLLNPIFPPADLFGEPIFNP